MDSSQFKNTLLSAWFAMIVIALAGFAVYSNTFSSPFVFDDISSIVENSAIRDVLNFFDFNRIPSTRPVVDLTFALNYKLGKLNVFGYRLVNIIIHIINGFIVYFLSFEILKLLLRPRGEGIGAEGSKLKGKRKGVKGKKGEKGSRNWTDISYNSRLHFTALFAALIFVAHPIQTQAVTYICQRYASMAALFYMASVLFYLKARIIAQSSKLKGQSLVSRPLSAFSFQLSALYALSILCGLLAFLSKQNTASLPLAILLVEYLCVDSSWESWKKKIPWIALAFIFFLLTLLYVSGAFRGEISARGLLEDVSVLGRETELVSRWSYLCTQFNVLVIYIRLLFIPIGQSLDHLYLFKSGFFDDYTPAAFLFLLGLLALGVFNRTKRPVITFGIFWFFITLSVESSIIPIRDAMFEHRLYLPIFGFALAIGFLMFQIFSKRNSLIILVSVFIIITALGTATYVRNGVWQDDLTLWKDVLSKNPENIRASNNLGRALAQSGRFEEADSHFSDVLRFDQEEAKAHFNKGVAMAGQGRFEEALRNYREALRINPRYAQAHYNSGTIFETLGELEEALNHYSQALRIKPDYLKPMINAGVIFARKGQMDKAAAYLSEALKSDPENAIVHNNLAGTMAGQGRIDDAIRHYTEALRIRPDYGDAHYNLGITLKRKGDPDGAIRHLSEAVRINLGNAKAYFDLGNLLADQGRLDEAIRYLSEAVRLQPDDSVPVCYNIACAYARQNRREEAIAWLKKAVEGGFNRWDLLGNDRDMENIRNTSYYKSLINDNEQLQENGGQESEEGGRP